MNVEKIRSQSVSPSQRQNAMSPTNSKSGRETPRKEIEAIKLKLPQNREKIEPRLKSPIDQMLKDSKKKDTKKKNENKESIPSHQNLELDLDYPDNNFNEDQIKKETPQKTMFFDDQSQEAGPSSPKRVIKLRRSPHVSPARPKSLQNTPKSPNDIPDSSRLEKVRSPVTVRTESPASVSSSHSISSSSRLPECNEWKDSSSTQILPASTEDLKDLKSTEVYFWEQTTKLPTKPNDTKEDASPDQSPQHVLTEVVVHTPVSPKKAENSSQPVPTSPQKQQNLRNLEAFYWHEIKKLKEKEEQNIYNQQVRYLVRNNSMNLPPALAHQHRSRSLTPTANRQRDKRSLSLPREIQQQRMHADIYGYTRKPNMIPEEQMQQVKQQSQYGSVRQNIPMNQNFARGSPQRSTVGPVSVQQQSETIYENYFPGVELRHQAKSAGYAPIFKRGSLANQVRENSPQNKKVSFSNAQGEINQSWPTKNGFTQSPPTRRVEKRTDNMDDEVFYPDNYQNLPPAVENEKNKQAQESPYGTNELNKMTNKSEQNANYVNCNPNIQNYQNANLRKARSASVEPVYISRKPPQYPQPEAIYSTRNEQIYGRTQKQITVNQKVCDMYGQIHDQQANIYGNLQNVQKSGVIYGQLQQNPLPTSPVAARNQYLNKSDPSFVRGGRLTASFNDMGRYEAPNRPLPATPIEKFQQRVVPLASESESGSEAGEVQRILEKREMNRRQQGECS